MVLEPVDKNLFRCAAYPCPGHIHLVPWDSFAFVVAEVIPNTLLVFYMRCGLSCPGCTDGFSIL